MRITILLSMLLLVISFGCGEDVVVEDLKLEERNGVMYLPSDEEPYTGEYLKWHENGQKWLELICKDGKIVTVFGWKPNGEKCSATKVVDGYGVVIRYSKDGMESGRKGVTDGILGELRSGL